jgi:hypothetical protein
VPVVVTVSSQSLNFVVDDVEKNDSIFTFNVIARTCPARRRGVVVAVSLRESQNRVIRSDLSIHSRSCAVNVMAYSRGSGRCRAR